MPYPAPYLSGNTFPGAKVLNIALYADDASQTGANGVPTGFAFAAHRPVLLEAIAHFPGTLAVGETRLDSAESALNVYWNLLDTAAIFGPGMDVTGTRASYTVNPLLAGSSGVGATPGGWYVLAHFIPISPTATQQAVGANMQINGTQLNAGAQQAASTTRDNCPFYCDLVNIATNVPANPSVHIRDSNSGATTTVSYTGAGTGTDAFSGENPRLLAFWAGTLGGWDAPNTNPALPSPPTTFTAATTVGTTTSVDVNVNTQIADVVNFLSHPPLFRTAVNSSQDIPNISNTQVATSTSPLDNFGGYSSATSTYTVQRDGLYLACAATAWTAQSTAQRWTGIGVGGTIFWGPGYVATSAGETISTKTQVLSLLAGDQVQLFCRQNSGSDLTLSSGDQTRLFLVWLCAPGAPASPWTPPDTSFRWQAGTTAADLPGLFQAHIANDLGFLVNRPYLLSYQAATQSGFTGNTWNPVTMDTVAGVVHGDDGDNYGGWDPVNFRYVAQEAGWYLAVSEVFSTFPASPPSSLAAGFSVPTSGSWAPLRTPDWFQHQAATPANFTPGATAIGCYYLLPGETIQPMILGQDYGGSSWGTAAGLVNGGQVNSHFEVIWIAA